MSRYQPDRHGPRRIVGPGFHAQVHEVVRLIPRGFVASYGDVAQALGRRSVARHVGWALAALPAGADVPWWRVVDGRGRLSRPGSAAAERQAELLRKEGLAIEGDGVVGFAACRADLPGPDPAAAAND